MTTLSIQPPFPILTDADGRPLENGYIWVGTANQPAQTNPITVYWDAALTIPAALPIRTRGGYPVNAGTPARLYVNSDYSILVQNKNGSTLYSAPDGASDRFSAAQISFLQAGSGAVPTTVQAKLRETVSVKDFGAVGDGVTDDAIAMQRAIDYAVTTGAKITLGEGPWYWKSVPTIPKELTDTLVIDGEGVANVILTTTGNQLFKTGASNDNDTFKNITIKGINVDGGGIVQRGHVIFGARSNNSTKTFLNWENITIEDVHATNCGANPADFQYGIYFICLRTVVSGVRGFIRNIIVRNVTIEGCTHGVLVIGDDNTGNASIDVDNINISGVRHNPGFLPTVFYGASNIHVGGNTYLNRVRVSDCVCENAGDNGIEINSALDVVVSNCNIKNALVGCYLFANTTNLIDPTKQRVIFENCRAETVYGRAFYTTLTNTIGHLDIINSTIVLNDSSFAAPGLAFSAKATLWSEIQYLNIDGLKLTWLVNAPTGSDKLPSALIFGFANPTKIRLANFDCIVKGTASSAGNYGPRLVEINGPDIDLTVENFNLDVDMTNTGTFRAFWTAGSTVDFPSTLVDYTFRGVNIKKLGTSTVRFLQINSVASSLDATHRLKLSDADLSQCTSTTEIVFDPAASANFVHYRFKNVKFVNQSGVNEFVPSASPTVFSNGYGYPVNVTVTGGTVSSIGISFDGGSTYSTTGITSGAFTILPGQTVRVIWTVAPTIRLYPQIN